MNKEKALEYSIHVIDKEIDYVEDDKKNAECGTYLVQNTIYIEELRDLKKYLEDNLK